MHRVILGSLIAAAGAASGSAQKNLAVSPYFLTAESPVTPRITDNMSGLAGTPTI
jgi:hypothetical protein